MSNPFAAFCDDFYVNMRLGSQLNLPHQRETLLHFFERIQKRIPRDDPVPQDRVGRLQPGRRPHLAQLSLGQR